MIKLQEVVHLLADVELGNISYVDSETKVLNKERLPALVRSINLGLLELHKRFNLKEGELLLNLQPGIRRYYLRPEYQVGKIPRPGVTQYIAAGQEKLEKGNLLKVEKVVSSEGCELDLDISDSCFGVTMPQYDVIDINTFSYAEFTNRRLTSLLIKYRKAPKQIIVCDDVEEFCCKDLDLPYTHLQALIYFVAMRTHNPIGFSANSAQERVNYNNLYETECNNLNMLGLASDQHGSSDRFSRGGWA